VAKFSVEAVSDHIRAKHPGCPGFAIDYMAREIAQKKWKGVTLGRAVGITMQNILRHLMTDYDALLLEGMDRSEARQRVQPKIRRMLEVWAKPRQGETAGVQNE